MSELERNRNNSVFAGLQAGRDFEIWYCIRVRSWKRESLCVGAGWWHCRALHCRALHCCALHCRALHCRALHCRVLHCLVSQYLPACLLACLPASLPAGFLQNSMCARFYSNMHEIQLYFWLLLNFCKKNCRNTI